jgi:ArsR family transcriptional regulator
VDGGDVVTSIVVESTAVETERAARVFAALADPGRLRILAVLADAGRCVCDIRSVVPVAGNVLSYHLRVLREAGLVEASRRGRWIDYRLSGDATRLVAAAMDAAGFAATIEQPAGCAPVCEVRP